MWIYRSLYIVAGLATHSPKPILSDLRWAWQMDLATTCGHGRFSLIPVASPIPSGLSTDWPTRTVADLRWAWQIEKATAVGVAAIALAPSRSPTCGERGKWM